MLLFKPEHVLPILSGEKTETRREWPKGPRVVVGSLHQCRLRMLQKNTTFAVVRIDALRREELREIMAIAKTTIRQFVRLVEYGITSSRLAYEHPEIRMKDVAEAIGKLLAEATSTSSCPFGLAGSITEAVAA